MLRTTLLTLSIMCCSLLKAQDHQEFNYQFQIVGITYEANDAIIKDVQTKTRHAFDALPRFDKQTNSFTVTTVARVDESRLRSLLEEENFTLSTFQNRSPRVTSEK